jgi:antitoxin component YwqK of YwqJK toxin-antitoxin module
MKILDDFYDRDEPNKLYYEDRTLVDPKKYHHPKNGIWKIYTEDGSLYMEISYKDNLKNGLTKIYWGYSASPILHYKVDYINDVVDGFVTTYYSDGAFKEKIEYKKGKKGKTVEIREGWHWQDFYYI